MLRKKVPKKEWMSFEEVYRLLDGLKMTKADFIRICDISSNTFYLWQRKGKIPASTLSIIKFSFLQYYEEKHQKNIRFLLRD